MFLWFNFNPNCLAVAISVGWKLTFDNSHYRTFLHKYEARSEKRVFTVVASPVSIPYCPFCTAAF